MSDYATYLASRCDDWRAKHPRRAAELRILVRRWLGIQPTHKSAFADASCIVEENTVIRVTNGWPTEDAWTPPQLSARDLALPPSDR